jgi:hypothetical protein
MYVRTAKRLTLLVGSLLGLAILVAMPASADAGGNGKGNANGPAKTEADGPSPAASDGAGSAHDPAGNNGTIKIDGEPFDDAPDNEPHPGCTFQVDFYGFDEGSTYVADMTFEAIAPTAGGVVLEDQVPIGEDSHAGGGSERGLDASKTIDLSGALAGITPHPKQGWHIKLTVHADGSQGADVKHKVFWVQDCTDVAPAAGDTEGSAAAPSAPAEETGVEANGVTAAPAPSAATTSQTSVAAAEAAAAATATPLRTEEIATEVQGLSISRAPSDLATPAPAAGHTTLARTGMTLGLLAVGAALIAGGIFLARGVAPLLVRWRS